MQILQIARRFVAHEWGGTETVVAQLTKEMIRRGHYTELWTSSALSQPGQAMVAGVPVRRFRYTYPFWGLSEQEQEALDKKGGNLFSLSMLAALFLHRGFDLYHLHTGKRFGAEAAFVAGALNRPYVMTLHGGVLDVPEIEREDIVAPIRGKLEWGKAIGALLGSRRLLERADAILCVNPGEVDKIRERMPGKRVEHLPNGVDPGAFSGGQGRRFKKKHGFRRGDRLILCVSRIDPQKNQMALIEAFSRFGRGTEAPHLVLIGPASNPGYKKAVIERAKELDVAGGLHVLPPFAHGSGELADAYAAADVFVLPSLHEPFGIVILEAWSAGCPVVATRVGGIPHFVEDGEDGLLVSSGDPEALYAAIRRVLEDGPLAGRLGASGFRKVESHFTWDRISSRLLELYESLVREKR